MIKSLSIKNFQSHKESQLEFCEGVNLIVGSSDSGKTAILRALNWVINNKPAGDSFRSYWGGDTEVTILTDSGDEVIRKRTNKENAYIINGNEFHAFGQDVPESVKEGLNFDSINIQSQLDAPFLFSNSSGEVAGILNDVVGLEDIDRALSNVVSRLKLVKREKERREKTIEELELKVKEYEYLSQMEMEVVDLENHSSNLLSLKLNYDELNELLSTINKTEIELLNLCPIIQAEEEIDQLIGLWDEMRGKKEKLKGFKPFVFGMMEVMKQLDELSLNIRRMEKQFNELMPEVCPLCSRRINEK